MNLQQGRRKGGGGLWGLQPPQYLAEQLTLSQPGREIMPTTVLQAPQIFKPCDGPVQDLYILFLKIMNF